ncbi:hypothetical protein [Pelagicoccus sp. SDUM812002]|uniref:baeRF3 domain-containing protein n=1 Tax=Pelagicoccus sp. SDUM812002 TaxID=3041266 RepID=UPI00280E1EA3|nr:hypothetical protein [Pelagicoccus sp. SDUM812002]MDQ8186201.1 hypothetical protein [Pelagicoccus sp. SDUM812002]
MSVLKSEKDRIVAEYLQLNAKPNEGCLTIAFATEGGGKNYQLHSKRLSNLLRENATEWEREGRFVSVRDGIIEQGEKLVEDGDRWSGDYEGVCIHLSDADSTLFKLQNPPKEGVWAGTRFRLRPAAQNLESQKEMLALSLSFKNPKLFRFDGQEAALYGEVELPDSVYDFSEDGAVDQGHRAHVRKVGGGSEPQMSQQGVSHEQSPRDLNEPIFLRELKHALEDLEESRLLPLVVIGDESIVPAFRKTYKHQQGELFTVMGEQSHSDESDVARICRRICNEDLEASSSTVVDKLKSADTESELYSNNVKEIVLAAEKARVSDCVLSRDAEIWLRKGGLMDLESAEPSDELEVFEALDYIFSELVQKGANVAVVEDDEVPGGKKLAALFRW